MGYVTKTKAGHFRANWRDAASRLRAKTFHTKREANAFLADVEASLSRGTYVDPHAGRMRFATTRHGGWRRDTTRRPPWRATARSCVTT